MAGFEVVVRPVVFPNIRPLLPRVLAPEDNSDKGICTIDGGPIQYIGASSSWNYSVTYELPHAEQVRQVAKERVHQVQTTAGGATIVNQDNYVEVERLQRVRMDTTAGPYRMEFSEPPPRDNVVVLETGITRKPGE